MVTKEKIDNDILAPSGNPSIEVSKVFLNNNSFGLLVKMLTNGSYYDVFKDSEVIKGRNKNLGLNLIESCMLKDDDFSRSFFKSIEFEPSDTLKSAYIEYVKIKEDYGETSNEAEQFITISRELSNWFDMVNSEDFQRILENMVIKNIAESSLVNNDVVFTWMAYNIGPKKFSIFVDKVSTYYMDMHGDDSFEGDTPDGIDFLLLMIDFIAEDLNTTAETVKEKLEEFLKKFGVQSIEDYITIIGTGCMVKFS